jgi:hypothetical protein
MLVYSRPDLFSQAPATARQEPDAPIFSGTPAEVAHYLGPLMEKRSHTLALVHAELTHLDRVGWAGDSLTFVLSDDTSVTVRP